MRKTKLGVIFILCFLSHHAFGGAEIQLKSFLGSGNCAGSIETLTEKWKSRGQWRVELDNKNQPLIIKSPTDRIGAWIILEKNENSNQIIASRLTANSQLIVSWDKNCESSLKNITLKKDSSDKKSAFDDKSLEALIQKKKPGLIYAFSPHMHLSVEGIKPLSELAKNLNIDLTIVSEIKSLELFMRGFGNHYPSLIAYSKEGKFSGIYPGRKSNAEYKAFIESFLQ